MKTAFLLGNQNGAILLKCIMNKLKKVPVLNIDSLTQVLSSDFKKTPVNFNWNFLTYWSAITNFEILRELDGGENDVKECKVCVGFHTFRLVFCMCNKLRLHAEILS